MATECDQKMFWQMQKHSSRNYIAILTVDNFRGGIVGRLEKRRQYRVSGLFQNRFSRLCRGAIKAKTTLQRPSSCTETIDMVWQAETAVCAQHNQSRMKQAG
jgi:hypothetical protein